MTIQETLELSVTVAGENINLPLDGLPDRSYDNRITTAAGHEVWWPDIPVLETSNATALQSA